MVINKKNTWQDIYHSLGKTVLVSLLKNWIQWETAFNDWKVRRVGNKRLFCVYIWGLPPFFFFFFFNFFWGRPSYFQLDLLFFFFNLIFLTASWLGLCLLQFKEGGKTSPRIFCVYLTWQMMVSYLWGPR